MTKRRDDAPLDRFIVDYLPDGQAIERTPLPEGTRTALYALTALLVFIVAWAAWAEVDRVVTAPGRLITTAPTVVVQPLETAIIRGVDVLPGDRVTAGQRLATLDPTFAAADLADLTNRVNAVTAKERRLAAEQADAPYAADPGDPATLAQAGILQRRRAEYAARLSGFDEQAGRLAATLDTSRATRAGLARRIAVIEEIESIRSQLHKQQTGSLLQLLEARNERLKLAEEADNLANRERETAFELSKLAADRAAFIDEWRRKTAEELVETARERATVTEQWAKAQRRAALVSLTAPVDAVVLETAQRSVGSVIKEAEPLFTLIPVGVPLEAEVNIPSADVGLVRLDDPVRVKLDAFPYQRYGLMTGRLRTVSADAFQLDPKGGGGAAAGGASNGGAGVGAVFRARVRLLDEAPAAAPAGTRPSPGMVATAEIIVGRRSVLSYFLYPIFRAFDESIREP